MNLGGPAQQAALLSGGRLDPTCFETLLVHGALAPGEESMAELAEREGVRTEFLPTMVQPVSPPNDLRALARLRRIVQRFRPQIVHTHTAKAGFLGRVAALSVRPRPVIVHTYHGHVLEGYFGPSKSVLFRRVERALARVSDCLIGVSDATVDDLVRLGVASRDRFQVVPLGLDLDRFAHADETAANALRGELGIGDREVLLTYAGRLVPIKQLDVLLRAFARARVGEAPIQLAVVGDGEIRPDLERLAAQLDIRRAVHFLGYRRDLPRIAAATDVAVLSSANEGTPVWLIEAAAAGCPAVATAVGGVSEVVAPDAGLLVSPGDEKALAGAFARLAGDAELRRSMGGRARDAALKRYAVQRLVADIESLYRNLVAARRAG